jgi:hypothetical protein
LDDWMIGAREFHRYATFAPEGEIRNRTAGPGLQGWFLPARTSRPGKRSLAVARPRLDPENGPKPTERRMEHRVGKRYRAFQLVRLLHDDACDASALLYNVSRNGMFVLTRHPDVGPNLCVDVDLRMANGSPIRLSTLVIHRAEYGLGLIFRHLDPVAAAAVEELCSRR